MSHVDQTVRYSETHEWFRFEDAHTLVLGISDYAQSALGDVVFVELPEVGAAVTATESCSVVESVKVASDIYTPVSGSIMAINEALADQPDLINTAPYGEGWLLKIKVDEADANLGMDPKAYEQTL